MSILYCTLLLCIVQYTVQSVESSHLGLTTAPPILQVSQLSVDTVLVLFYGDNVMCDVVFLPGDDGSLIVGSHLGGPWHWVVCLWIRCRWVIPFFSIIWQYV